MDFKVCITAEVHYLNQKIHREAKKLVPVLQNTKRVILLSGTPVLSRPVEIFNLLKFIRPDFTPVFATFT